MNTTNSNTRKILITHHYPLSAPGGGTKSCKAIANSLAELGHTVTVLQMQDPKIIDTISTIKLSILGSTKLRELSPFHYSLNQEIRVYDISRSSIYYLFSSLAYLKAIKYLLKDVQYDAVFSWDYEAAFLYRYLKKHSICFGVFAARPSYAAWINRKSSFKFLSQFTDNYFRWMPIKNADLVFVASNYISQEISDLFELDPSKLVIIYRGIDQCFLNSYLEVDTRNSNQIRIIYYGSFAPIKGVFDAIKALGVLKSRGCTNWKFYLAGWGEQQEIEIALLESGIQNDTEFLGYLKPEELAIELKKSHIALLPSRMESFGRAVAEAQAVGLPVVSYRVGSIQEIIEDQVSGILAPLDNIDKLGAALEFLIQNPSILTTMGKMGHKNIRGRFTWEKTSKSILEALHRTLNPSL